MARLLAAVALALTVPVVAFAQLGIPSPATTTRPNFFNLVGTSATGTPDLGSNFNLVLRDVFSNPIANRTVRFSFTGCGGDVALSSNQPTASSVNCATRVITFTTNGSGVATGQILGYVPDFSVVTTTSCALIEAENLPGESPAWVSLGTVPVGIFDLDGVNGVNAHDFLNFMCDLFSGQPRPRSDFDHTGGVNAADYYALLNRILGVQAKLTAPRCDAQPTIIPPVSGSLGAFNLRWGRCPQAYSAIRPFACDEEDLVDELTVSVIAPVGITSVAGADIELEVSSENGLLPDWWRLESGGCRDGSLSMTTLTNAGISCPPRLGAVSIQTAAPLYSGDTPDRLRIRVLMSYSNPIALTAGNEYTAARLVIDRYRATTDPCSGCELPVQVKVRSMRLIPTGCASAPLANDVVIETPGYAAVAYWQGIPQAGFNVWSGFPRKLGAGEVTARIHGAQLQPGCSVLLRRSGESDVPGVVETVAANGYSLFARFDLTGKALGDWDIVVTNPDLSTATSQAPVEIVPAVSARLDKSVTGSNVVRTSWPIGERLKVWNIGNVDFGGNAFAAVYVPSGTGSVTVSNGTVSLGPTATLPQGGRELVGVFTAQSDPSLPGSDYGFNFFAPGVVGLYEVRAELFQVPGNAGATVRELVRAGAVAQGFTWPALSPAFLTDHQTQLDQAMATRTQSFATLNAPNLALSSYPALVHAAVEDALGALAGSYASDVTAYRTVWDPLRQTPASWSAFQSQLPSVAAAMAKPPAPVENYPGLAAVQIIDVRASVDPNDKSGPGGPGEAHHVASRIPLSYVIHFENLASATAAAQAVSVDDQLDPTKVDLSTLSLGRITFDDRSIDPPPGLTTYAEDVDLRPGQDLIARVTATLSSTGMLSWRFQSLDPATMAPTTNAILGFLPPNATAPEGEGSVSFVVSPLESTGDGTAFPNWARIVFDDNAYIDTPVWTNTLDFSSPTSQVTSLTATQDETAFDVAWSGSDGGSGIADYTVFVRDNGGPYTVWQDHVTATNAQFTGQDGHVYDFYSTARDQVGQVESAPGAPDASTQIVTGIADQQLPARFGMRLAGRNPVRSGATIELALPRAGSARIEVIDVSGRLVFSRDIKELKAGYHPITLTELDRVAPGVFMVRATSGGESAKTKIAVVR